MSLYFGNEDTIVAIGTTLGGAARGIVRLSGPDAVGLAEGYFAPDCPRSDLGLGGMLIPVFGNKHGESQRAGRFYGSVRLAEEISCGGELYVFRGPHSFSGEDMAELHVPGSAALLRMLLEGLLTAGARQAQPGEFTARAFFNGRIDLSEAEAVAEVINARSDAQLRGAARLLDGALRRHCRQIAECITELLALVEAGIDFSNQEIELISARELTGRINAVRAEVRHLLDDSISWDELNVLPQVALAGPANAGKSSLTNALLGMDRSIVAAIAGTTRDLLTAPMHFEHGECLLIDTAGLGLVEDEILAEQAQECARRAIAGCDLLLWVVDVSDNRSVEQIRDDLDLIRQFDHPPSVLVVANKIDLCQDSAARQELVGQTCEASAVAVSALTGDNLTNLKSLIEKTLHGGGSECSASTLALTARQREELRQAAQTLTQAAELIAEGDLEQAELVALELRGGLDHLAGISGKEVTEEVLGIIFSRFCVGK
jgi:tRNA modification GTPase